MFHRRFSFSIQSTEKYPGDRILDFLEANTEALANDPEITGQAEEGETHPSVELVSTMNRTPFLSDEVLLEKIGGKIFTLQWWTSRLIFSYTNRLASITNFGDTDDHGGRPSRPPSDISINNTVIVFIITLKQKKNYGSCAFLHLVSIVDERFVVSFSKSAGGVV